MDAGRFDRIAVLVGGAASRRAAVRLLAAGVLSAIAELRGSTALGRQGCTTPCAQDEGCCEGECQFLGEDDRCGSCTTTCVTNHVCQECVTYDPGASDPFPPCPDAPAAERFQCCPPGQHNANGLCCQQADPPAVNCCTVADAPAAECVPTCLPLTARPGKEPILVDDAHCGECGKACTGGKTCVDGECICPADRHECVDGSCRTCCHDGHCADGHCCSGICRPCCDHDDCELDQACCNGTCKICTDKETCQPCARCCNNVCCSGSTVVCHTVSGACCVPDSLAQTCGGQCGEVGNNCGITVDCGPCECDPPCAACQVCDLEEGQCLSDPRQVGDACGTEGQVCQSDGTCACDAVSCPACTTCANTGSCAPCPGCCADGACIASCGDCHICEGGQCVPCPNCCRDGVCVAACGDCQTCKDGQCVSCASLGQRCCDGICVIGDCCTTADCPSVSRKVCPSGGGFCHCRNGEAECNDRCCRTGHQCCHNLSCQACCDGQRLCNDGRCHDCCTNFHCPGDQFCCADKDGGLQTCQDPVCSLTHCFCPGIQSRATLVSAPWQRAGSA